jgi:hypothetical protein
MAAIAVMVAIARENLEEPDDVVGNPERERGNDEEKSTWTAYHPSSSQHLHIRLLA